MSEAFRFFSNQTFITFGPQMRVAIFFTYLCFLLLRGNEYAFTATQDPAVHHAPVKENEYAFSATHHLPLIKEPEDTQEYTVVDTTIDNEEEYLISDDIEEEDPSNFLVRKYKLLARYYVALSCPLLSGYLYKSRKAPPSFQGYLSYIYITQRVLRL